MDDEDYLGLSNSELRKLLSEFDPLLSKTCEYLNDLIVFDAISVTQEIIDFVKEIQRLAEKEEMNDYHLGSFLDMLLIYLEEGDLKLDAKIPCFNIHIKDLEDNSRLSKFKYDKGKDLRKKLKPIIEPQLCYEFPFYYYDGLRRELFKKTETSITKMRGLNGIGDSIHSYLLHFDILKLFENNYAAAVV